MIGARYRQLFHKTHPKLGTQHCVNILPDGRMCGTLLSWERENATDIVTWGTCPRCDALYSADVAGWKISSVQRNTYI